MQRALQDPRECLGEEGLSAACGPNEQNVALLQFHVFSAEAGLDSLVVVVNSDSEYSLSFLLTDHVFV